MKIALLCIAVLALLQVGLAMAISKLRREFRISTGAPDDPDHPLSRRRTAFSNCAEWHPTMMILLLALQMHGAPNWAVWLSPAVVAARCLMVAGLVTYPNSRPNKLRVLGAVGTYLLTVVLAVTILVTYW